ncbi:MAG: TrmH family RNA methyltransferase [Acutalibacteraceae bacterium]
MTVSINSPSNEKIKHTVKIAASSRYRKECSQFFLEGLRLCFDAAKSGSKINSVFFTEKAFEKNSEAVGKIMQCAALSFCISESVCAKLAQTQNSQGVFCLCDCDESDEKNEIDYTKKYIALESVQNPDNLGAISRTAEAFGLGGIILSGGCDIYNPKALRASMGSLLRLPVIKTDNMASFLKELEKNGMKIYATTPDSSAEKITEADFSGSAVCVIGNEANGISEEVFAVCQKVTIPMSGRTESFNAATAAAVTMWEMVRKQN